MHVNVSQEELEVTPLKNDLLLGGSIIDIFISRSFASKSDQLRTITWRSA